jgi:protein-L-isoaspartate(D-aspartate) O-methyltransferase
MVDFALARKAMMDSQVSTSAVTERRLLGAMGRVPRERFLPPHRQDLAYIDDHHALGNGRFLAAPATFARLVQVAAITQGESVLDLRAGTGYGTAILAALASDVLALEPDPQLAASATDNLAALGLVNATIVCGEISDLGARRFDVIFVEDALDGEPRDLINLLKPGGRVVALVRRGRVGIATRYLSTGQGFKQETFFDATLPPVNRAQPVDDFVF